jgi:hypothetical protein
MSFFGSRISDNLSRTKPEGFLVCHDVPIARTGWLDYSPRELGLDDPRPVVRVYRSPEDLFSPATMSSFEGKSVTDQHPPVENVDQNNYSAYERGHVQNVRKGEPLESGDIPLIANLLIKDPGLASQVEPSDGVRHVSIGYTHKIVPFGKDYKAINLRGNHVAVVPQGRAGHEIAIRDDATVITQVLKKSIRSNKSMAIDTKSLFGRMLKAFAVDAEPDEVAAAAKMGEKDASSEELSSETVNPLDERMSALETAVTALVADKKMRDDAEEAKKKPEPDEDLISEDEAEQPAAVATEPGDESILDPEDRPENPIPGADTTPESVRGGSTSALTSLRQLKPFVAKSGDKSMIDAFNTALRAAKGGKRTGQPGHSQQDAYKALSKAIAVKSADAEAALVDSNMAEMTAYKAMLDAAGEKAAAGYRRLPQ